MTPRSTGNLSVRSPLRVFVASPRRSANPWLEVTRSTASVTHIRAGTLLEAQRVTKRLHEDERLNRPEEQTAVVLEVEIALDADPGSARRSLARERCPMDVHDNVRFVGTSPGLAGLIADIYVAEVADGVALVPLLPGRHIDSICDDVLAWLRNTGLLDKSGTR